MIIQCRIDHTKPLVESFCGIMKIKFLTYILMIECCYGLKFISER